MDQRRDARRLSRLPYGVQLLVATVKVSRSHVIVAERQRINGRAVHGMPSAVKCAKFDRRPRHSSFPIDARSHGRYLSTRALSRLDPPISVSLLDVLGPADAMMGISPRWMMSRKLV
jgi:hypothetical protein